MISYYSSKGSIPTPVQGKKNRELTFLHFCLLVHCVIYLFISELVCLSERASALCCSGGWQPYWHFLWWFRWAYSIRITEGFHPVCSSLHAKEVSLEPLFTNQVGFAALRRSQAKAQLPSNPLQCPSHATNTLTYTPARTHTQTSPSGFHLVAPSKSTFFLARICSKLSTLQAFYVNLVVKKNAVHSYKPNLHPLKKKGGGGGWG